MSHWTGLPRKLIAVSLLAGLLAAACGGGEEAPPAPTPTRVAVATPTTPPVAPSPTAVVVAPTPTRVAPAPTPTQAPAPEPAIKRGGILRARVTIDPGPWNILQGPITTSFPTFLPVLNTLIQINYPKTDIVGDLAESWTVSKDGKEVTFKLLPGVKWHDGRPLTASDIKLNLDRVFFATGGFRSHLQGLFTAAQLVEAPDDSTVKIILKQPSNSFIANMTHPLFVNYPSHVSDEELVRGKVVGTGPFLWEKWERGVSITQKRNPNFFRKGPRGESLPYLDGIQWFNIFDSSSNLAAFRVGQIDVFDSLDSPSLTGKVSLVSETDFCPSKVGGWCS